MKYKLTKNTKELNGIILYQIQALRNIRKYGIVAGDPGGWIEGERNLSQEGDAWVSGDAQVSGDVWVTQGRR